jgi:hypothetical protein
MVATPSSCATRAMVPKREDVDRVPCGCCALQSLLQRPRPSRQLPGTAPDAGERIAINICAMCSWDQAHIHHATRRRLRAVRGTSAGAKAQTTWQSSFILGTWWTVQALVTATMTTTATGPQVGLVGRTLAQGGTLFTRGLYVNVDVNELRLGFSNTTRNPEGILSHNNRKS